MKKLSARTWLSIITFILLGILLFFSRHELEHAWELLGRVDLWILALLVPVVMISHLATGEMFFAYLRKKGTLKNMNIWTQMRVSLELNFVNHLLPSGGVSGLSYVNWRLSKFGVSAGKATMAQAVRYVAGFGAMIALLFLSVLLVTIDGDVNRWIILMSSALVFVMCVATGLGMYLMSNVALAHRLAWRISRWLNALTRKVTRGKVQILVHPTAVVAFIDDLHDDYEAVMRDKRLLVRPFLWGLVQLGSEIMIFWLVFWALGTVVNPAAILIAYGLASLAGFAVVTPGGAGAYEAIMVTVLAVAGVVPGVALAGIVLARAIILFITIVVGYIFYQQVVVKYGKRPRTTDT